MKNNYILRTLFILLAFTALSSCGNDDAPEEEEYVRVSPVQLDLNVAPYPKLSDYRFFDGEMKNLQPAYKVIPYDLNSSLFTDYAKKKRFIWMPEGVKATYNTDGTILNFPTGTVLIKNFYYDNVQPANTTRIIETRLMIRKADGWVFANYKWNDEQTEAFKIEDGSIVNITWLENGSPKTIDYEIPYIQECARCHQNNLTAIPIGTKPQNLNKNFTYSEGSKNQLSKWIEEGYLASAPGEIASTVDWTDATKPLNDRVRSYLDINCAHCHSDGGDCDQISLRLPFSQTTNNDNLGICIPAMQSAETMLIDGRNRNNSAVYARMITNDAAFKMPLIGRTIVHEEAKEMMRQWINSLENCN